MDNKLIEFAVQKDATSDFVELARRELSDVHLSAVGGGIADVIGV